MRSGGIAHFLPGVLISLFFWPGSLVSQTVELSRTPLAEASARHGPPASGITRSVLGNLPLQFEENEGQADGRARFLARGPGYTLFLNSDGLALNLSHTANNTARGVSMHLLGAQVAEPLGREQTVTQTNYYLGSDPHNWHLAVPSYRSVIYPGIYKGIDLIYHGNGSELEYDFVISPGTDPNQIRARFEGLKPLLRGKDLSFEGQDQLSVRSLKAFQMLDGKKKAVDADWEIRGDQASIHLGSYDHGHELTIDPIFFYGTYIGGNGADDAVSVIQGASQSQYYVALSTSSAKLEEPGNASASNPNCNAGSCGVDTLILEIQATTTDIPIWGANSPQTTDPNSTAVTYPTVLSATYLGGNTGTTKPISMVADSDFNLYATGSTTNPNGLPSLGTKICSQNCTGYVAKLNSDLTPIYSLALAAIGDGIGVDKTGDAYITGMAAAGSLTIPQADLAFQQLVTSGTALASGTHAYLLELGPTGALLFSSFIGGSGTDQGKAIAVSDGMNPVVYVTGQTSSTDFPTKCTACQTTYGGGSGDAFVLAISSLPSSPVLNYSTYLGGSGNDSASSIAVDSAGNAVLVGFTASTNFPNLPPLATTPQPFQFTRLDDSGNLTTPVMLPNSVPPGSQDGFVTSLSADGTLRFTDFLGGSDSTASITSANGVVLDRVGVIYVTGTSNATIATSPTDSSTDFMESTPPSIRPPNNDGLGGAATTDNWQKVTFDTSNLKNNHVFFAQIDPIGQNLLQATIAGGLGDDQGKSVSVAGYCFSSPPPPPPNPPNPVYPPCIGTASIVGSTDNASQDKGLFGAASTTTLYPVDPSSPSGSKAGFFVQEELAGYCNMQLQQQLGSSLTLGGPCVSGTSMGTVSVMDSSKPSKIVKTASITINEAFHLTPSASLSLDLSGVVGIQPYTLTFSFLPLGAIGAVGACTLTDGTGGFPSGCPIVQTGGGGAGTIFDVTSGTLTVALSCPGTDCTYNNMPNSLLVGQPVTLNATVTNGVPNTVNWISSGGNGTFTGPNPSTSIMFTPGGTGGLVVITAAAKVDPSVTQTITLKTFEPTSVSFTSSGPFIYGQTNITVNLSSSANSVFPTGSKVMYQVDQGSTEPSTLSNGSASIDLHTLAAGSHTITVSYPGDSANFLANSSNSLNFTVNQAPLTVTANSPPPITFGQPIPALTYTITGFVNGDTSSVVTGTAALTTTATSTSQPGDYPISFSTKTLAATNYSFNYVDGTLTITAVGAAPPPIISPAGGSYTSTQTATITDSLAGAKLHYTTDGTEPTSASTLYAGPIAVNASVTIRAIAVASGYKDSATSRASFNLSAPTLSALSISFGNIVQGTLSDTETIMFTNPGANTLGGLMLALGGANAGEFALGSGTTCGTSLSGNSSCSVAVTFTPTSLGARNATLAISYAGIGSPQTVNLGGVGVSPLSITSNTTQLVAGTTFQFTASAPAVWSASAGTISSSGFFTAPNPPPTPAQITVTATSTVNPQIFVTTQITIVSVPAIIVPATNTLPVGGSVTIPISIAAGTGIAGESMTLACSPATLPTGVSCSFVPNPVINTGGAAVTLQLFSNNLNANLPMRGNPWEKHPLDGSAIVITGCIFLIGFKSHGGKKMMLVTSALAFATLMSLAACGTGGSFHSNASSGGHVTGTYTINITASGATPGAADFNQTLTTVPLKVTLQ
jgi:hypothetical protein